MLADDFRIYDTRMQRYKQAVLTSTVCSSVVAQVIFRSLTMATYDTPL